MEAKIKNISREAWKHGGMGVGMRGCGEVLRVRSET
jgi:hypothetical protein